MMSFNERNQHERQRTSGAFGSKGAVSRLAERPSELNLKEEVNVKFSVPFDGNCLGDSWVRSPRHVMCKIKVSTIFMVSWVSSFLHEAEI